MSATTRTISYHSYRRRRHRMVRGVAAAISLAAAAAFLTWAATARSAELVPSIGVTRAVDGDENTKTFLGLGPFFGRNQAWRRCFEVGVPQLFTSRFVQVRCEVQHRAQNIVALEIDRMAGDVNEPAG